MHHKLFGNPTGKAYSAPRLLARLVGWALGEKGLGNVRGRKGRGVGEKGGKGRERGKCMPSKQRY